MAPAVLVRIVTAVADIVVALILGRRRSVQQTVNDDCPSNKGAGADAPSGTLPEKAEP